MYIEFKVITMDTWVKMFTAGLGHISSFLMPTQCTDNF